jgi:hypothetical protein
MISCAECLTAVLVADRGDMDTASAVGLHCANCADCTRVVTQVRERERRVELALADVRMSALPSVVAQQAIVSNRRVTAHFWRMGLFAAFMAIASIGVVNNLGPFLRRTGVMTPGEPIVTETIALICLTPAQATSLATPFLRSSAAVYSEPGLQAVTVRGKRSEFQRARAAIKEFDLACPLTRPPTVDQPPPTSPARPGKD